MDSIVPKLDCNDFHWLSYVVKRQGASARFKNKNYGGNWVHLSVLA